MNRFLILNISCVKNRSKAEAQMNTWGTDVPKNIRHIVVEGGYEKTNLNGKKLELAIGDDYANLCYKMLEAYRYILQFDDWDYVIKADDDVYWDVYKALEFNPPQGYDAFAILWDAVHISGPTYILTRKAVELVVKTGIDESDKSLKPFQYTFVPEDHWVCETMYRAGLKIYDMHGSSIVSYNTPQHFGRQLSFHELMAASDNVMACFEMTEKELSEFHEYIKGRRKFLMNENHYLVNSYRNKYKPR